VSEPLQRTEAWRQQRLGAVTASRIADVVARTKTGWGASRANYAAELIAERLTGVSAESYQSAAMKRGTELEAEAIALYGFAYAVDVVECGFVPHPKIAMSGASPDGLVGADGLVEVKVPNTSTHIDTLLGGSIARGYLLQMQWQLACTGREWCDFVSYDPRMPVELQLHRTRVPRDPFAITDLAAAVVEFLAEIDCRVAKLESLRTAA
jgi:putative phage-type endonuclease